MRQIKGVFALALHVHKRQWVVAEVNSFNIIFNSIRIQHDTDRM